MKSIFSISFAFIFFCLFEAINSINQDFNNQTLSSLRNNTELENKLNDLLKYYKDLIKLKNHTTLLHDISKSEFDKSQDIFNKEEKDFNQINSLIELQNKEKNTLTLDKPYVWKKLNTLSTPPFSRRGHSTTVVDNYMIVFGGCYMETRCFNDLYFFDMVQKVWSKSPSTGDVPSKRQGHSAILYGSTLWIFGGSNSMGYLNDLYSLNLETRVWKKHDFKGTPPSPRANFGAVVNNDAKIIIFGGYTDTGYDNNIHMINLMEMRYEKPLVIGKPPSSRQSFGITLYKDKLWVYGGFTESSVLNDLYSLDTNNWLWKKIDTSGIIPEALTGSIVTRVGKNLYLTGGCDKIKQKCFNSTYRFNLDKGIWKIKTLNSMPNELLPRQDFSQVFYRGQLVLFGGCEMYRKCFNDIYIMNIKDMCPLNCLNRGLCKPDIGCVCKPPFIKHDCSLKIKCQQDCNDHGLCHSNGKCGCYPGWSGLGCDKAIPCLHNCTSEMNGICQSDSTCKCKPEYTGKYCQERKGLKENEMLKRMIEKNQKKLENQEMKLNNKTLNQTFNDPSVMCPRNCSGKGVCDKNKKRCVCKSGYVDIDCSVRIGRSHKRGKKNKDKDKNKKNKNKKNKNKNRKKKEVNKKNNQKNNENKKKNVTSQSIRIKAKGYKSSSVLKPDIFQKNKNGSKYNKDKESKTKSSASKRLATKSENKESVYFMSDKGLMYMKTFDCSHNCTGKGICLNSTCFCKQGKFYYKKGLASYDCSMTYKEYNERGYELSKIWRWSTITFVTSSVITLTIMIIIKLN